MLEIKMTYQFTIKPRLMSVEEKFEVMRDIQSGMAELKENLTTASGPAGCDMLLTRIQAKQVPFK